MADRLLSGIRRHMVPVPPLLWRRMMGRNARRVASELAFMVEDHHRVRDFVVRELPGFAAPMPSEFISRAIELPVDRVIGILDELERHMTFLFRNEQGAVAWAYPVTVDQTPHHMTFSTGERVNAA